MTQPNPNNPYINKETQNTQNSTQYSQNFLGNLLDSNPKQDFLKGALIGAAATFILTNENAQRAIFKGFAKISSLFESGIEELKERYEDAKAEINDSDKI
ncbi:YtxH domain-containing protein [uncultured Helicobacter sp.]|uniref:YtxH domain-containing protein n=1 Tax=uncultured Helicobacter sp. TaxID=175537 RepID=UPI0026394FC3|nr:YtxH domain-containing protein [uncultured Helicobacter sp.]